MVMFYLKINAKEQKIGMEGNKHANMLQVLLHVASFGQYIMQNKNTLHTINDEDNDDNDDGNNHGV